MRLSILWLGGLCLAVWLAAPAGNAAESRRNGRPPKNAERTVESLAALARPSVVVISQTGRDGREEGMGAGVAVASNLIATCLHVIGEARPVTVRVPSDGPRQVREIYAWDRKLDLAILQISGGGLVPLPLGDSDDLKQGAQVVAIGNPLGLENSIVQGVLSAKREFEGAEMLQLAIPIEPGNSGGPLLDMQGRVQGLLNMKSALTANLGFAIPVNALKKLLEKPNGVPMQRWLSFSSLRTNQWLPVMGAQWSQRGGAVYVEGAGSGFGGRSLLLSQMEVPPVPYELSVEVRLDDESGAAGLAFDSDGGDVHYGFYPTGGQLRLTHFEGPNVFSWNILSTVSSAQYRRGDWNHLRVCVEADRLRCYVNGQLTIESPVSRIGTGKAGLAKFRQTKATFKNFAIRTNSCDQPATAANPDWLRESLADKDDTELLAMFKNEGGGAYGVLRQQAREFERDAERLRNLARTLHQQQVTTQLVAALSRPEKDIDLFHAALLISRLDNPELDIEAYRTTLDDLARDLKAATPSGASAAARLDALKKFLFVENGFHGSRGDYYNRANSYIDRVIDDREGIPITLSILFIELGSRIGLDLAGVGLPGHFVVKHVDHQQWIDVFDGAAFLSREQVERIVVEYSGRFREEYLKPATRRDIIVRMLHNLLHAAGGDGANTMLRYLDVLVALSPDSAIDRFERARLRITSGNSAGAREDLAWILDREPAGIDLDAVRQLYRSL